MAVYFLVTANIGPGKAFEYYWHMKKKKLQSNIYRIKLNCTES